MDRYLCSVLQPPLFRWLLRLSNIRLPIAGRADINAWLRSSWLLSPLAPRKGRQEPLLLQLQQAPPSSRFKSQACLPIPAVWRDWIVLVTSDLLKFTIQRRAFVVRLLLIHYLEDDGPLPRMTIQRRLWMLFRFRRE